MRQTKAVCPLKKLGDRPREMRGHDLGSSETGNNHTGETKTIDKRRKAYQEFGAFLTEFIRDLNHLSEEDWALLIEGKRDDRALRKLGYTGRTTTVSSYARLGGRAFGRSKGVVILTDLDREGGILAARFVKKLSHEGRKTSLAERRRLKSASKGVFLHVENLSRFADTEAFTRLEDKSL